MVFSAPHMQVWHLIGLHLSDNIISQPYTLQSFIGSLITKIKIHSEYLFYEGISQVINNTKLIAYIYFSVGLLWRHNITREC